MATVLTILSVIGHILLICLAVIIVIILLLLFWPLKYKADGKIDGVCNFRFKLWWLFHIFGLTVIIRDNKPYVWAYFFKKKKVLYRSSDDEKEKSEKETSQSDELNQPEVLLKEDTSIEEPKQIEVKQPQAEDAQIIEEPFTDNFEKEAAPKKKNIFQSFKEKCQSFYEKFAAAKDKVQELKDIWNNEEYRALLQLILKKLKYLGRHIKPQSIRTNLTYSLADPCLTGKVTAVMSMIPLLYIYDFGIYPDFEADTIYIKGTFHMKGHIRLIHVAIVVVSLLLNKNIRKLIKKLRQSE